MDKYVNGFTRANPGLIIFIVDQSDSMNTVYEDGRRFAEVAADSVNNGILELALRFTAGTRIKESAFIAIITHGGIDKNNARLYRIGKISELFKSPLRVERHNKTISDGAGGMIEIDWDLPVIIESRAEGESNLSEAFDIAYNLIQEWRGREDIDYTRDIQLDPVPLIVNIAPEVISYESEIVQRTNRIKGIEMEDGNPMILNCVCTNNNQTDDFTFGYTDDIASDIPQEIIDLFKHNGYPDINNQCKLTINNIEWIPRVIIPMFNAVRPRPWGENLR